MTAAHPAVVLQYLQRVGARVTNFRRAVIEVPNGHYQRVVGTVRISAGGEVTCSNAALAPTADEAEAMKLALAGIDFPRTIVARNADELRGRLNGALLYEFIDRVSGGVAMVQERRNNPKAYVPWVMLSDGEWVMMEPDDDLPFFKPREDACSRIMIHEGAKAALAAERIARDPASEHPWAEKLAEYSHWGLIGGATRPYRTDWEELRREAPREVVYVCDADNAGVAALPEVAKCWGLSLKGVVFGEQFPQGFDMADPLPKGLFTRKGRWFGPRLEKLMIPATWATHKRSNPKGKGADIAYLNEAFRDEWLHCLKPEIFVHRRWPDELYTLEELNGKVAPFSDVENTARLLRRELVGKSAVLKYIPGQPSGIFGGSDNGLYINTFVDSDIKPEVGPVDLWLEFMERLVPSDEDRHELMRWVATLVGRPDIRMKYGVLMVSETQGVGKGTLGEHILSKLVGAKNFTSPSEQDVVDSAFNDWMAHKRLAVIHEIYSGHSTKAYDRLKSSITDTTKMINKKYQVPYVVDIWIHLFACSNSRRALKLDDYDRRWLIPKVSESKPPREFWERFFEWIEEEGGLGIIKWWCGEFLKEHGPVLPGEVAPMTDAKREMIRDGYSAGQEFASNVLEQLAAAVRDGKMNPQTGAAYSEEDFLLDVDVVAAIKDHCYGGRETQFLERPLTIRAVAKRLGFRIGEVRCQVARWGGNRTGGRVMSLSEVTRMKTPGQLAEEGRSPVEIGELLTM